jgi:hypothetical protein
MALPALYTRRSGLYYDIDGLFSGKDIPSGDTIASFSKIKTSHLVSSARCGFSTRDNAYLVNTGTTRELVAATDIQCGEEIFINTAPYKQDSYKAPFIMSTDVYEVIHENAYGPICIPYEAGALADNIYNTVCDYYTVDGADFFKECRLSKSKVKMVASLIDDIFFQGTFSEAFTVKYGAGPTRAGGLGVAGSLFEYKHHYKIHLYNGVFNAENSATPTLLDGWPCKDALDLMIHTIMHEMGHVLQTAYGKFLGVSYDGHVMDVFNGHDGIFASLVYNIFGHPMGATEATVQDASQLITRDNLYEVYEDSACSYRDFHKRAS